MAGGCSLKALSEYDLTRLGGGGDRASPRCCYGLV